MSLNRYDAPTGSYISKIPSGTAAFRSFIAHKFSIARTEVVRDRSRCAGQRSEHCECGAVDFFPVNQDPVLGRKVFDWCVDHEAAAGVQSVIFRRRVIGFGNPTERHYDGRHDHFDHVHVGLDRWARANLTMQMLERMDGQEDDMAQISQEEWEKLQADVADIRKALYIGQAPGSGLAPIQLDDYVRAAFKDVFAELKEIKDKLA